MKKILIPTDFSLNSNETIDYVTKLFINEYCEFYFFNTYTYGITGLNAIELLQADDDFYDKPKEESLKLLGKLVERYTLKYNNPKHTFNAISEYIGLIDGLKENIRKIGIDLVILTGKAENTVSKATENIIEKIRTCPILIVPPHPSIHEGIYLKIVSDFKRKVNIDEIHKFCKALENTKFDIGILVLGEQNTLTIEVTNNLESLLVYMKQFSDKEIGIEYMRPSYRLNDYAASHLDDIICIMDSKPDVFRKIGIFKSSIIPTLGHLCSNTVLTIHQ